MCESLRFSPLSHQNYKGETKTFDPEVIRILPNSFALKLTNKNLKNSQQQRMMLWEKNNSKSHYYKVFQESYLFWMVSRLISRIPFKPSYADLSLKEKETFEN